MVTRAALIWCALLMIAILNGGFRDGVLVSWFGREPAQAISTVLLSAAILAIGWVTVPWIELFGKPWTELADYNLLAGRIWIVVLAVTLLTPVVVFVTRMPAGGART